MILLSPSINISISAQLFKFPSTAPVQHKRTKLVVLKNQNKSPKSKKFPASAPPLFAVVAQARKKILTSFQFIK